MRLLKIKPARDITELALSPDGRHLGVIQSHHGFRLHDALSGAEVGDEPEYGHLSADSPTGRHFLSVPLARIRLAEVAAGRPWLPFQTGWTREGDLNRPPDSPGTLALPWTYPLGASVGTRASFDHRRGTHQSGASGPRPAMSAILHGALSADHRFAVGRIGAGDLRTAVCDLACEAIVAADLDVGASLLRIAVSGSAFTPDGTRVIAATLDGLFVFDLPPVDLASVDLPAEAPVLKPAVVIPAPQPPPALHPMPPFAVLPCGRKALMRGERSRVELRDLATGELLTAWKWLRKVNSLAVAADGLTAAAGGASGRVVIWDLE